MLFLNVSPALGLLTRVVVGVDEGSEELFELVEVADVYENGLLGQDDLGVFVHLGHSASDHCSS